MRYTEKCGMVLYPGAGQPSFIQRLHEAALKKTIAQPIADAMDGSRKWLFARGQPMLARQGPEYERERGEAREIDHEGSSDRRAK